MGWWPERLPLWRRGERAAAWHLRLRGYRILGRNLRFGHQELDILAKRGDTVVFVEVRTRASADPIPPEDSITPAKRRHLRAAARQYLARHESPDLYYRFDVIGVVMPPSGKTQITHIPDAFRLRD